MLPSNQGHARVILVRSPEESTQIRDLVPVLGSHRRHLFCSFRVLEIVLHVAMHQVSPITAHVARSSVFECTFRTLLYETCVGHLIKLSLQSYPQFFSILINDLVTILELRILSGSENRLQCAGWCSFVSLTSVDSNFQSRLKFVSRQQLE